MRDGPAAPNDLMKRLFDRFDGDPSEIVRFARHAAQSDYEALASLVADAVRGRDEKGFSPIRPGTVLDGAVRLARAHIKILETVA